MPIISQWFPEFFDRYGALTVFDLLVDYIKSIRISLDKSKIRRRVAATKSGRLGAPRPKSRWCPVVAVVGRSRRWWQRRA